MRLTIACCALLLLSLSSPATAQDQPPYLYYYADTLNAFVIERADGSDSRTIGQGLIPDDATIFSGAGFSPSGNWFGWSATDYNGVLGRPPSPTVSHIASLTSGQPHPLVNGLTAATLAWSPISDLLLIVDRVESDSSIPSVEPPYYTYFEITLLNLETDSVMAQTVERLGGLIFRTSTIEWSVDGSAASFYVDEYLPNSDLTRPRIFTIYTDGRLIQREVDGILGASYIQDNPYWQAGDWFVTLSGKAENTVSIENFVTDKIISLQLTEATFLAAYQFEVYWDDLSSPRYALIHDKSQSPSGQSRYRLWLVHLDEQTVTLIDNDVYDAWFYPPAEFERGSYSQINFSNSFSPQADRVVFRSDEEEFSLLTLATGETMVLDMPYYRSAGAPELAWSADGDNILIQSNGDGNGEIVRYALADSTIETTSGRLGSLRIVDFAPYRAISTYNNPYTFTDTRTDDPILLPRHSMSTRGIINFIPHELYRWIITGDSLFVAGGEDMYRRLGVYNMSTGAWRELGGCYFAPSCVGWLPAQVDVARLPQGAAQSVLLAPVDYNYEVEMRLSTPNLEGNAALICADSPTSHYTLIDNVTGASIFTFSLTQPCPTDYEYRAPQTTAVSPDGTLIAMVSTSGGFVEVWEITRSRLVARLNTFGYELSFSADGDSLYTRSTNAILTWRVDDLLQLAATN